MGAEGGPLPQGTNSSAVSGQGALQQWASLEPPAKSRPLEDGDLAARTLRGKTLPVRAIRTPPKQKACMGLQRSPSTEEVDPRV